MSYALSFDEAMSGSFQASERQLVSGRLGGEAEAERDPALLPEQLEPWRAAASALDAYLESTGQGRFAEAAQHLERLQEMLEQHGPR